MRGLRLISICLACALSVCGLAGMEAGESVSAEAAEPEQKSGVFADEQGIDRYTWTQFSDGLYSIRLDCDYLDWLLDSGKLQSLADEYGSRLYVEIEIDRLNVLIPKEFFQIMESVRASGYIFVKAGRQIYDWGFSCNNGYIAQQDFSPYITFSRPDKYQQAYGEGAVWLEVATQYQPESSGFTPILSVNTISVDGKLYRICNYFSDFFAAYATDEVKYEGDRYGNRAHDLYGMPYPKDRGWFYFTQFGHDGAIEASWKEYIWEYNETADFANVEGHQLFWLTSGTFVLSDQAAVGNCLAASVTPAPAAEAPTTAAPATDAPATDAPTTAVPTTDAPTTAAPATDAPATDAPATDAPATAAPTTYALATETPTTAVPVTYAPTTMAPGKSQDQDGALKGRLVDLEAEAVGKKKVRPHWDSEVRGRAPKLVLYRKYSGKRTYKKIKTMRSSSRKYMDTTVKKGKSYVYKLVCQDVLGECVKSTGTVSGTVSVPYLTTPAIRLKKRSKDGEKYLQVSLKNYDGIYAEIYLSKNKKQYAKVPIKKAEIKKFHGKFLLRYQKPMGKVYCKVRTWRRVGGKKRYSQYSSAKKIRLN